MTIIQAPTTEHLYSAELAGTVFTWDFHFPETKDYLRKWITGPAEDDTGAVRVSAQEFSDWEHCGNTVDAFAEFCLLCQQTSEALLPKDRLVIHAGAVHFRGRAFLIAGGSGVGKSTQIRTLQELCSGEIGVINGDKPVLECCADGCVIVYPSPWNGKEGMHGADAAPLGGIFLLRRGSENAMERVTETVAAPFLYLQIFQSFTSKESIRLAGKMEERILRSAPVFLFTSNDVPASTRLLIDTLKEITDGL